MNLGDFQLLVEQNAEWFRGVSPETSDSLLSAERLLSCLLPTSMKWLLSEWGYSEACGIASLDESVKITLQARQNEGIPERYIILNDWGDVGVVFFDAGAGDTNNEYRIYYTGAHNFARFAKGEEMDNDADIFEDYPAWVLSRLEIAKEWNDDHP